MRIPENLNDIISREASDKGYFVLEISLKGRSGEMLEIVLDKPGGITLEECSIFNGMVTGWLDKNASSIKSYIVDVSSPGLDRVLKSDSDFDWAVGKAVKVNVSGADGKNVLYEGEIKNSRPEELEMVLSNGDVVSVHRKNILKARLKPAI